MEKQSEEGLPSFKNEVWAGLASPHKYLSSKYFYDETGDLLFQRIMHLDEYYLTRKELEIFESKKHEILTSLADRRPLRIIELGAGDGLKTKVLLKHFDNQGLDFTYVPVDISPSVLKTLSQSLQAEIPHLKITPHAGDYFEALKKISDSQACNVVFFLGSNIGNFAGESAGLFLNTLRSHLKPQDLLFMGVDLKKDPDTILSAYNDSKGVTAAFNLNLLERINKELDANFDTCTFLHRPCYHPQTGECRSYLVSKIAQKVCVAGKEFSFRPWEALFMEVSKKYDKKDLDALAQSAGYDPVTIFTDAKGWFADVLWEVKR